MAPLLKYIFAVLAFATVFTSASPTLVFKNDSMPHPSAPKPVPSIESYLNGTGPAEPTVPTDHPAGFFCDNSNAGTCTVGLLLSASQWVMDIFIWDHSCKLLGAAQHLLYDYTTSVSSDLGFYVVVTPHNDVPSEFWYNGNHYQDGWNFKGINNDNFYVQMLFWC